MLPVRCFSCNKVLGHFSDHFEKGEITKQFLETHNIRRYCCKKILLTTVDVHEDLFEEKVLHYVKIKSKTETKKIVIAR